MSTLTRWVLPLAPLALTAVLLVIPQAPSLVPADAALWLSLWGWSLPVGAALVAGVLAGWRALAGIALMLAVLVVAGVAVGVDAGSQPGYQGDGLEFIGVVLAIGLSAACAAAALVGMLVGHLAHGGSKTAGAAGPVRRGASPGSCRERSCSRRGRCLRPPSTRR